MIKKATQQVKETIQSQNEKDARHHLIEELFYDLHRSRKQVYWMNFFRGIFFGVGSVIGGTLVVAIVAAVLSALVDLPGGVGEFVEYIVDIVRNRG